MRNNIVLIDFENVPPAALESLLPEHFRVLLFVGANQTKLPFATVAAMQKLGSKAEYIQIAGSGTNALDFHIAYYIGVLSATDPLAYFHVVSKDTGFDRLIQHLKSKKVLAGRVNAITEIPMVKSLSTKSPAERIKLVVDKLAQLKVAKPRTLKALSSSIASLFQKQLSEAEVSAVVAGLVKQDVLSVTGTKIAYGKVKGEG